MATVESCYLTLLGREPDAGSLAAWVERLERDPMDVAGVVAAFIDTPEFRVSHGLVDSPSEAGPGLLPQADPVSHEQRTPPQTWRVARRLIARSREHAFLDRRWIGPLLRIVPRGLRRSLALRLLGLSPHYWVYQWTTRYPAEFRRDAVLEAEFERNAGSRREIFEKVLQPALTGNQAVLDFGCGPGFLAREVAGVARRVEAVDVSRGVIACARALNPAANLRYRVNRRNDLKVVRTESMDFVYSFAVFQHLLREQTARFFCEFGRVLKPGGSGMFHTILRREDVAQYTGEPDGGPWLERDVHLRMVYLSAEEITVLLRQAGLAEVQIDPVAHVATAPIADDIGREHLVRFSKPFARLKSDTMEAEGVLVASTEVSTPPAAPAFHHRSEARWPMRWIMAPFRAAWRGTAWARRPLASRLDAFIARAASRAVEPSLAELRDIHHGLIHVGMGLGRLDHLGPIHEHLAANRAISEHLAMEANLLMDGLLREVTRLQLQVEELRECLDTQSGVSGPGRFGLVAEGENEVLAG
jgi:2-polyprenyl-3-methyl-5-hydroxy-6-metoxy-1,4-benzoquinol methylase